MGTWGTEISSNDTYSDIYNEFFVLYNDGLEVAEISKKLIADNKETINDTEDGNNFWFALAKAQWECKQLDKYVFDQVKKIIETGTNLEIWRQLDANEKDIKKRKVVLDKFHADLHTKKSKAKSRKKIIYQPIFDKGDCLTFKLENGNYGGAVVIEANKDSKSGQNLILTTRINQSNKPTKKDFENAEVLVMNHASWDNELGVHWFLSMKHKQIEPLFEKVDKIDVQINYDIQNSMVGIVVDFDIWIIQVADQQFKSEETKLRSTIRKRVKELTKK